MQRRTAVTEVIELKQQETAHQLAVREHELGAERPQQDAALRAHGVGHGQHQLVALGRRDVRQANAGVAAGRLNLRQRVICPWQHVALWHTELARMVLVDSICFIQRPDSKDLLDSCAILEQVRERQLTSVVLPGEMSPSCSARLIMFSAMRSLTLRQPFGICLRVF